MECQMSMASGARHVKMDHTQTPQIIHTEESLWSLILTHLQELNITFEDCRGQAYDCGADMRGKKGVPRSLFVPYGSDLDVANAAKSFQDASINPCFLFPQSDGIFWIVPYLELVIILHSFEMSAIILHVKAIIVCTVTTWQFHNKNIHLSDVFLESCVEINPPSSPFKVSHSQHFPPDLLLTHPHMHRSIKYKSHPHNCNRTPVISYPY